MSLDLPDNREQMDFMVQRVLIKRHLSHLFYPLVPLLFVLPLFLFLVFVLVLGILIFRILVVSHARAPFRICQILTLSHMPHKQHKQTRNTAYQKREPVCLSGSLLV